jgi:hypothetical protein
VSEAVPGLTHVRLRWSDGSTVTITAEMGDLSGELKLNNDVLMREIVVSPFPIYTGNQYITLGLRGKVKQVVARRRS